MSQMINVLKYYLKYKYTKFEDEDRLKGYQEKKLKKRLEYVTEHSGFYNKYKGCKLEDFPIIDKKIMMDNFDSINTVGINREEALSFAIESEDRREFSSKLSGITVGLSSGTSYSRGIFLVEDEEKDKWAGYVLARFLPKGILSKCSIAFFMRANSNLYENVGKGRIRFDFFDIYKDMEENFRRLNDLNADIIVAQPSVLLMIAAAVKEGRLRILPEKVISIAEVLERRDEEYLKKVLGLDVIHQVYQCTEGCLATTCSCGRLHLNEDIVYIEKEYIDDERFVPIITDLERTSQPIIRYRLNDILVEDKKRCECGLIFTPLIEIEGREDDVFIFAEKNGNEIPIFPDFIRRCILFAGDITDYRIVQEKDSSITVYADIDEELRSKVFKEFEKLSLDQGFILSRVRFKSYTFDKGRKLKRVERSL
ncbi:MAG: hypothetical protein IJV15_00510 [Lachnospiraceae bacterium]|nr:hypothetical protein [Lachnospiraceae bacterium]